MKYLLLLFLLSCSGGGSNSGKSTFVNPPLSPPAGTDPEPIEAETILLNYNSEEQFTKVLTSSFSVKSDKSFSFAEVYRGDDCNSLDLVSTLSRPSLSNGAVVSLIPNQTNVFSLKVVDLNNLISINCEKVATITHDTVAPITLGMSNYLILANKNVSAIEFYAGGDINQDHPEALNIAKVVYYKLEGSSRIKVGEFSVEDYNNKNIRLILNENEANLFYFSVIDKAGNESDQAGLLIVDHQNTFPSAPLLSQELINLRNRYTDQTIFLLKGIVGLSSQRVRVYSDSNKNELIADELSSVFEGDGIAVPLSLNSYNDFYIVAVKNGNESPVTSYGINQKTTPPNKPVVDPYIMQVNNLVLDDDFEKYIAFYGTIDPDVVKINIYSDVARTDLLISYNADDWISGTGPLYLFSEGLNTLYFVSVDDVGRESTDSVSLRVTFDTEE